MSVKKVISGVLMLCFGLAVALSVQAAEKVDPAKTEAAEAEESAEVKTQAEPENPENPEKPEKAAVVNGTAIPMSAFEKELGATMQRMATSGQPMDDKQKAQIKKKVLNDLINRHLLWQASKAKGIEADQAEIDKQMAQLKQRFPEAGKFQEVLDQMGLSEADLRQQMAEQMVIQEFVTQEIVDKIEIPEAEIKTYYEKNPEHFEQPEQMRASHILIKTDPKAEKAENQAAQDKLADIRKKLEKGEDFAELAKEYSEGPSSEKGGDLGFFSRGQMVKPFEEAAFALEPGEISEIVKTRFGYHLIKETGHKPAGTVSYDEAKERIKGYLKKQRIQKALDDYVKDLRDKAEIQTFVN